MPFIKPVTNIQQVDFLASEKFQSFTTVVTAASVTAGADGRKIAKAGTIYPANTSAAKGILLHDVDVTYGDQPAALIVAGYILVGRLPVAPAEAAITALKDIRFQ